jgi:hypothetical protein
MATQGRVHLTFMMTPLHSSIDGKPTTIGMEAAESSTPESTLGNDGGLIRSIRFTDFVAQSWRDISGESLDLAGTMEWTCGSVFVVTIAVSSPLMASPSTAPVQRSVPSGCRYPARP